MSVKTAAQISAEILTNVSDALTKQNTAAKLRQVLDDLNDTMDSGKVLEASLAITSAQILTLNSVPINIVSAPGSGKYIEVISSTLKVNYLTAPYAVNTTLQLINTGAVTSQVESVTAIASTISKIAILIKILPSGAADTQILENTALQVKVQTGNPSGGFGDIVVKVLYRIVTI